MEPLTAEQFISEVIAEVKKDCRCASPDFQKLISFNFNDYGIAPTLLWDSEILIQHVIRNGFDAIDEGTQEQGDFKRRYQCPICARICTETFTEFSIGMYRSFVVFDDDLRASRADYILGFRGFDGKEFEKINDFFKIDDFKSYLARLTS